MKNSVLNVHLKTDVGCTHKMNYNEFFILSNHIHFIHRKEKFAGPVKNIVIVALFVVKGVMRSHVSHLM